MKAHHWLLALIPFLITLYGCSEDVSDAQQIDENYANISLSEADCDPLIEKRKTVDRYKNEQGELQLVEVGMDEWQVVIVPKRFSKYMYSGTFQVCNLPDTLTDEASNKREVIFSGLLKEVYPTENMLGSPFKLTSIKVKTTKGSTPASK